MLKYVPCAEIAKASNCMLERTHPDSLLSYILPSFHFSSLVCVCVCFERFNIVYLALFHVKTVLFLFSLASRKRAKSQGQVMVRANLIQD